MPTRRGSTTVGIVLKTGWTRFPLRREYGTVGRRIRNVRYGLRICFGQRNVIFKLVNCARVHTREKYDQL